RDAARAHRLDARSNGRPRLADLSGFQRQLSPGEQSLWGIRLSLSVKRRTIVRSGLTDPDSNVRG
ncbi:MAG: hypothetical protein AAFX92_21620, partial [Pseudomonadota bacterium]